MGALNSNELNKASPWAWLDRLIWSLIYGGLLTVVLGLAAGDESSIWGWSLGAVGAVATAAGCVLIYIRSSLKDDSESPQK